MADIAWAAISGGSQVVRKSITINSSQNWVAPVNLAGNTAWVTGCAGAGSGGAGAATALGGFGGCYCVKRPVTVTAGATYAAVIGAGGAAAGASGYGNSGGDTTLGSILTLKGGAGGPALSAYNPIDAVTLFLMSGFGVSPTRPMIQASGAFTAYYGFFPSDIVQGNRRGADIFVSPSGLFGGGAAGLFGNGTDGVSGAGGTSAASNSGAGSGGTSGANSSTGGSGRLIIEWDEFL